MMPQRGRLGLVAGVLLAGAIAFYVLAPYNIAASRKHWPGVGELLHGYMGNAVAARAATIEIPGHIDLSDPALIRLGAAHFATGCATCHGAPGLDRAPVARRMQPAPPRLDGSDYSAEELYWLALHGLKYTGMPAWPGLKREDEPWAVAAFLSAYDDMDVTSYRAHALGNSAASEQEAIAFGDLSGPLSLAEDCARCHGRDGQGRDGTAPKLAGQSAVWLEKTLKDYASGRRQSGFMGPVAAPLTEARIAEIAAEFAGMSGAWTGRPWPDGDAGRGAELARAGDEHEEVASCASCHGLRQTPPARPEIPRIAGQDGYWLVTWLRLWRDAPQAADPAGLRMHAASRGLSDDDIDDIAAYYSSDPAATR
ncbi:c-type cytochrome [Sulfitobacter sp. D35]|uniref:c-type cytochrome n=1 Tax=Sulfitobacter sp. D35 TaxID=3083252 RepID=UPI0029700946|nr:c-type cytochrome [Sulfitobacter sp. D35]MDW4500184.1 c-type cytochrome [Sulfitobacter sp. D35]